MFGRNIGSLGCADAREWISLAMDDQLDESSRLKLADHLVGCTDCRRHQEVLDRGRAALRSAEVQPSDNFEWKVQLGIQRALRERAASVESRRSSSPFWRPALTSAAAVALLVVGAGSLWLSNLPDLLVPSPGAVSGSSVTSPTATTPATSQYAEADDAAPTVPDLSGAVPGRAFEIDPRSGRFGIRTVASSLPMGEYGDDLYLRRSTSPVPQAYPTLDELLSRWAETGVSPYGRTILNLRLRGVTLPASQQADTTVVDTEIPRQ